MEFETDLTVPFALDVVFAAYRDRLPELADYLPNIQRIEVTDRRVGEGGEVVLVNEWVGGGEIPKVARSFVKESMLCWTDYATWFADSHTCSWRTEAHAFGEAIHAAGRNRYVAIPEGTQVQLRGEIRCDAAKIPGVPRLLRKTVSSGVERILVSKISDNGVQVAAGLRRLLESS